MIDLVYAGIPGFIMCMIFVMAWAIVPAVLRKLNKELSQKTVCVIVVMVSAVSYFILGAVGAIYLSI